MKLKHTSVVGDFAEFMNLTVFWIKFVPLEMNTFVNIKNSLWMIITHDIQMILTLTFNVFFFLNFLRNNKSPMGLHQNYYFLNLINLVVFRE